ncbi:MAG: PRC-barrel domain-containing protein [Gemmobacter sp.]
MTHPTTMPGTGAGGGGAYGFVRTGYDRAETHDLTTADVESATVYGRDDETIGSISALKVGTDGKITDAVIDVGGFLGMGAHSVLLPFSQLTVLRETGGSAVRVHLDTTKDKLKSMPHHTG